MNKEPIFKTREAFSVIGIERYTANGITDIREAWGEIGARFMDVKNILMPPVAYGVEDYSLDFDMNAGGFPKYYYIAGFEVTDTSIIPDGMKLKNIPAAQYAVFCMKDQCQSFLNFSDLSTASGCQLLNIKWIPLYRLITNAIRKK